jgi:hypothetical protein
MIQKYSGDARARKQVEPIHRVASRMERLIGDLLDVASIRAVAEPEEGWIFVLDLPVVFRAHEQ